VKRLRWQLLHALRSVGLPGWAAIALAVVCVGGWWGLTVPLQDEAIQVAAENARLERRLAERRNEPPPEATPQQQLETFARRFPSEKGITASLARLHAAARKHGVQLDQGEFRFVSESGEPLSRYTIVLPVRADYRALRRFTRDAMRDLPGLALEEANLRRGDAKAPALEAQLRFVLFVMKAN
jgi:Tfp pilus assembly protein PilO